MNKWAIITLVGFVDLIMQFFVPDIVPEAIERATANSSHTGVSIVGEAALIVYIYGGYIMFFGGIVRLLIFFFKNRN